MTIPSKPGNQPDANDMAAGIDTDGEAPGVAPAHPTLEDEEEEAAKLGDFA